MDKTGYRKYIVAIIGSRTHNKDDFNRCRCLVTDILNIIPRSKYIVMSGGCPSGADYWARKLSEEKRFDYIEAPAFWSYGKGAGFIRNKTIAAVADCCVAVWNGKSTGTEDTLKMFNALKKPLWILSL